MPASPCAPGCGCGLHSPQTVEERFWSKVDQTGDCWLWTSSLAGNGYGQLRVNGRYVYAHRLAYELEVGPIPEGHQIDHRRTCPRRCVRPDHLRPATTKQNNENRAGATVRSSTGVLGVSWDRTREKYRAVVTHNGRYITVGRFGTIGEAEAAVIAKRNELFTHNDADRGVA